VLQYSSGKNDRQHPSLLVDLWMQDKTTTQVPSKAFKYVAKFKYLATIPANQCMHEEVK
jgi:hypothetical protein